MHLALVISSLGPGGAERVMSSMANYWSRHGLEVSLVTLDSADSDHYPLEPSVHRIALGLYKGSGNFVDGMVNNLRRARRLREAIRNLNPDVVISFLETVNVLTILATRYLGMKVVVMEHTSPENHQAGLFWNTMRRLTYPFATRVGVLTERSRHWAERLVDRAKVFVMPNAISIPPSNDVAGGDLKAIAGLPDQSRVLVSMGRLGPEKGFDLLIEGFAKVSAQHPDLHLVILGEGAERKSLEQLRASLGMDGRIHLPGRVSNPMHYLRQCELYVMSSRYEGFPMALCEAMASGLPVISFDCPTGPGEIIRNDVDGILVPPGDLQGLASAIHRLLSDESLRRALGARGSEILDRFSEERIMGDWTRLLAGLR